METMRCLSGEHEQESVNETLTNHHAHDLEWFTPSNVSKGLWRVNTMGVKDLQMCQVNMFRMETETIHSSWWANTKNDKGTFWTNRFQKRNIIRRMNWEVWNYPQLDAQKQQGSWWKAMGHIYSLNWLVDGKNKFTKTYGDISYSNIFKIMLWIRQCYICFSSSSTIRLFYC